MPPPLVARLLLDAQDVLVLAADAVPGDARDDRRPGRNAAGWVVAHAAFFHDVWMNVDARGLSTDEVEPWARAWFRRQQAAGPEPIDAPFVDARASLARAVERATPFVESLTDAALDEVPAFEPGAWEEGTTVGYLVARDVAHLFSHAAELVGIAVAAGGQGLGLPGPLRHTAGRT